MDDRVREADGRDPPRTQASEADRVLHGLCLKPATRKTLRSVRNSRVSVQSPVPSMRFIGVRPLTRLGPVLGSVDHSKGETARAMRIGASAESPRLEFVHSTHIAA